MTLIRHKAPEWTPERDAKLSNLWHTALTCKEIAAALGGFERMIDRGGTNVSARAHALGLPARLAGSKPKGGAARYKSAQELEPRIYRPGIDPRPKL